MLTVIILIKVLTLKNIKHISKKDIIHGLEKYLMFECPLLDKNIIPS